MIMENIRKKLRDGLTTEDLAVWFGTKKKPKGSKQPKGPWVNICRKEDGKHPPCGRDKATGKGYPKCRAVGVAAKMTDEQKRAACAQKRRAEKKEPKVGKGNKPTMASYKPRKESMKKTITLKESELISLIERMIKESDMSKNIKEAAALIKEMGAEGYTANDKDMELVFNNFPSVTINVDIENGIVTKVNGDVEKESIYSYDENNFATALKPFKDAGVKVNYTPWRSSEGRDYEGYFNIDASSLNNAIASKKITIKSDSEDPEDYLVLAESKINKTKLTLKESELISLIERMVKESDMSKNVSQDKKKDITFFRDLIKNSGITTLSALLSLKREEWTDEGKSMASFPTKYYTSMITDMLLKYRIEQSKFEPQQDRTQDLDYGYIIKILKKMYGYDVTLPALKYFEEESGSYNKTYNTYEYIEQYNDYMDEMKGVKHHFDRLKYKR